MVWYHGTFARYVAVSAEPPVDEDPLNWTVVDEDPEDPEWHAVSADHLIRYIGAMLDGGHVQSRKGILAREGFMIGLRGEYPVRAVTSLSTYFQSGFVLGKELREMIQWTHEVLHDAEESDVPPQA